MEFSQADHCSVTNCTIKNSGGEKAAIAIKPGAKHNLIQDCRFINIAARSVNLTINEDITTLGIPTGNFIRNNRFQDIPAKGENGRETIKIGQNQPTYGHVRAETIVENNTFLRCDGEGEIISNKCAGNIYRNNTFRECEGELVMRGGKDCIIEGNRLFDCRGGIRLSGTGHTVRNNWIINSKSTGIRLLYGITSEQGGHYQAASGCSITQNTIVNAAETGIHIGDGRNKDWEERGIQSVAPWNNRFLKNIITGNRGDLVFQNQAPNNEIRRNIYHLRGEAVVSNPGDDSIYGDPLFRNEEDNDLTLLPGSPALQ